MDFYNLNAILEYAMRNRVDISPADRGEWAMFCCALKTLGYNAETFASLSSCSSQDSHRKWREETSPTRYFATPDKAKAKLIALAKSAGIDLRQFRMGYGTPPRCRKMPAPSPANAKERPAEPPIYITPERVEAMADKVEQTNLYTYLCSLFLPAEVDEVLRAYSVGATTAFGRSPGLASAFPYINAEGECVDIHLQPYDLNGHRRKQGFTQDWQLRRDGHKERRGDWCLFGEHLLKRYPTAPVAIVESEKTALICALHFKKVYIWMATGSLSNLNARRCSAVRDRQLYIFPDVDGIEKWRARTQELINAGFRARLCDDILLTHAAGDKDDLGDIVIAVKALNADGKPRGAFFKGGTPP